MTQRPARAPLEPVDAQKHRRGLTRLWHAARYSCEGLRAAWHEAAFRLEVCLAVPLLPLACWLGRTWLETALLAASVMAVLVVELLNTAVEAAIDRIGPERHPLSKKAKDLGSAAVLLTLMTTAALWLTALWVRFF